MKKNWLLAGCLIFFATQTFASVTDDEEYNFSWLDPDKKVYVLQNRKYRKAKRIAAFLSGGINITNPYRTAYMVVPRAAFWFTEQFGVEAFGSFVSNSENGNFRALKNATPTALPYVREIKSYYSIVGTWTPWYAKINMFNKILYFDWQFNAGLGTINTAFDQNTRVDRTPLIKNESHVSFNFGTAQNYYVTQNILVRLDFMGMVYSATGADSLTATKTFTNFDFSAGVGYLF